MFHLWYLYMIVLNGEHKASFVTPQTRDVLLPLH